MKQKEGESRLLVNEIFSSIQGEGGNVGKPVTFIRLSGCNLQCEWCDTDYEHANILSEDEIYETVTKSMEEVTGGSPCFSSKHYFGIVFTGGEPCMQNIGGLLNAFSRDNRYWLGIETNGTLTNLLKFRGDLDYVTVSPKILELRKKNKDLSVYKTTIPVADEVRLVNVYGDSFDRLRDDILEAFPDSFFSQSKAHCFLSPMEVEGSTNLADTVRMLGKINAYVDKKGGKKWDLSQQIHKILKIR